MKETNEHYFSVIVAMGESSRTNHWPRKEWRWPDFRMKCMMHRRVQVSLAQYMAMEGAERARMKDGQGFVGGTFRDDTRSLKNLEQRTLVTLDLDAGSYNPDEVIERVAAFTQSIVVGYSTFSHTPRQPRIRLVIPLKKAVAVERYGELTEWIIKGSAIGDYTDDCSARPAQLFYFPSAPRDAQVWSRCIEGVRLDPDKAGRATSRQSSATVVRESSLFEGNLADPREKTGWIGAFCRVYYPINRAIEELLGDVYIPSRGGRYRYAGSKSEAGLIIMDAGAYAYSNHTNTDAAADGHCHHAYDLVRIHRCGGNDTEMIKLCQSLPEVLKEYARSATKRRESPRPAGVRNSDVGRETLSAEAAVDDVELMKAEIVAQLEMGKYRPLDTPSNAKIILTEDKRLKGKICYDSLRESLMACPGLPWFGDTHRYDKERVPWNDRDDAALECFLSDEYGFKGKGSLSAAVSRVADTNHYHPIREYLRSLQWDGVPRLETLIIDHLGAQDNAFNREATLLQLVAAVARVEHPGVKFDYMLILRGEQGAYKSTFVRTLFDPWYTDSVNLAEGKDSQDALRGNWGVEFGELAGMKKVDTETLKAFVTRQEDKFRPAYARHTHCFKRQSVFFGTTNEETFLVDEQNRRFSIICIEPELRKHEHPAESLAEVRDQVWAEAYHRYLTEWKDRPLVLSREAAMEQEQRNSMAHRNRIDPLRSDLEEYITRLLPPDWGDYSPQQKRLFYQQGNAKNSNGFFIRNSFCLRGFLWEYYGISSEVEAKRKGMAFRGALAKRIVNYLQEFGKWTGPKQATTEYGRVYVYEREETTE